MKPSQFSVLIATGLTLVLGSMLPGVSWAQPVINAINPQPVSAGTGALITVSGTGFGAPGDTVYFPSTTKKTPTSWGAGWVTVEVPETSSGNISIYSAASGLTSAGFEFEVTFSALGGSWQTPHTWYLHEDGAPGCTFTDTENRVQKASWSWECASDYDGTYGGSTTAISLNHSDGINTHGWLNYNFSPNLIASASMAWNGSGVMTEADVSYNAQHYTWSCDGAAGDMDVENIVAHEFGHTIGFGDLYGAADNGKTMFGNSGVGQTQLRSLHIRDVEGAEYHYPRAGRPNLTAVTPGGWYGPIVPRDAGDATQSYAPLSGILVGNWPGYVNVAQTNNGLDCAAANGSVVVYLDEAGFTVRSWAGVWGAGNSQGWLNMAATVRGGRHTFHAVYDSYDEIVESNEADNLYRAQFAWSPYGLADQVPVSRTKPPDTGFLAALNCEGFQITGNWWGSVGICPRDAADDYDLLLFNDYTGSTQGYQTSLVSSAYGAGQTDFVLVNGNVVGFGPTRWAGVTRYSDPVGSDVVVHQSNQVGPTLSPTATYGDFVTTGVVAVPADHILKVHEVYLADTSLTYGFYLNRTSGAAELDMGLYDATSDHVSRVTALVFGSESGNSDQIQYKPVAPGYYGVAVYKRASADLPLPADYELTVGVALSNLNAAVVPSGFASPAVPRNTADAGPFFAPLPAVLNGPDAVCYLNWSVEQEGPNGVPPFQTEVYVDDEFEVVQVWPEVTEHAPGPWWGFNLARTIRGGRHTMTVVGDAASTVLESNEGDNSWSDQWVWTPLTLAKNTPVWRGLPPLIGLLPNPNCDGMKFTRTPGYGWVVGITGQDPSADYDLLVFDDYSGSTSGFSNQVGGSFSGSGATDFVVGHYSGTLQDVYPGVIRFDAGAGASFVVDASDADGRNVNQTGQFLSQTLTQDRLVDVYEAFLTAGQSYLVRLYRTSGATDLSFSIFDLTGGAVASRGSSSTEGNPVGPDQDLVVYTATQSEWHPIVVFRPTGADLDPATYDLVFGPTGSTGIDDGKPKPERLRFAGAYPNPLMDRARLTFELPGEAPVALDLFDLNGRLVRRLVDRSMSPGRHEVIWDGRNSAGARVPAGKYFARLRAGTETTTGSLLVAK